MIITREYLIQLLDDWQHNTITTSEIYQIASTLYFPGRLEYTDWEGEGEDEASVTDVVFQYLDCLDINFITQDDIEPCKEFLRTPIGQFDEGWKKWRSYISTINHQERLKRLEGQYPYIS